MAFSRTPKLIPIQKGEHSVSPHITSLKKNQAEELVATPEKLALPAPRSISPENINPNLVLPSIPRRAELQQKLSAARAKIPQPKIPKFKASLHHAQFAFVIVALLIVTPLKAITTFEQLNSAKTDLEELKNTAADELKNGGVSGDFSQVGNVLTEALRSFHKANNSIAKTNAAEEFILTHTPFFGEKFGAATRLVSAGEHVSLAAVSYLELFRTLREQKNLSLVERLTIFIEGNRAVLSDLEKAEELVQPIDPNALPDSQKQFVEQARAGIIALHHDAAYLSAAGPVLLSALGNTTPRRYLVVFQNPTELRPTGGFIGSFAIIDIKNGEINNIEVPAGGSYDLQGLLKKYVRAPLPLHIINPRWEFQDGNWFPDFPTSAKKLMWFLEKSQGPTVDGVIAVNSNVFTNILETVGSIKIDDETELTADQALTTIRNSIDAAVAKKQAPKQIIAAGAPAIIEAIKANKTEKFLPLITILLKGLEHRDIQLYAHDATLQKQIAEFGWDGSIVTNPNGDYLAVITTNIGGQKTDARITQHIDHQAVVAADGTTTVTVRLARTQTDSLNRYEGAPNISYVRFYVPAGAKLIAAEGFTSPPESMFNVEAEGTHADTDLTQIEKEIGIDAKSGTRITDEFQHTVFGNWMITKPGTSTYAQVSYELPNKLTPVAATGFGRITNLFSNEKPVSYSLYLQRQSGLPETEITSRVIVPDDWGVRWVSEPDARVAANGILLTKKFTNDIYYGITAYAKNNSQKTD